MKYIITESRINQTIKKYIESNYDNVISVNFRQSSVWLASDNRAHDRTIISVIVDPHNVLGGGDVKYDSSNIRRELWSDLNTFFSLGFDNYGSDWGIEVYGIKLQRI
jgi:hypothetical protein